MDDSLGIVLQFNKSIQACLMTDSEIDPTNDRYRAGNLIIRRATHADDGVLQQILRNNPMQGWIQLALERSPSYFAGEDLFGRSRAVIGQDTAKGGAVIGMYHNRFMPVFVNGTVVQAGYLGELRINPTYRNRIRIFKHGFAAMRPLNRPESDTTQIWFTSIASDNHRARRLLESQHRDLPRYTPVGELQTLAISTRKGRRPELLRQATPGDISMICNFYNAQAARYQFAPHLTPDWLSGPSAAKGLGIEDFWLYEVQHRLLACVAIWDQRSFKQAVVKGYRFPLNRLRPLYNLTARLLGKPLLPMVNTRLESVYLALFTYAPQAETAVQRILQEALHLAARKNADTGLLGLSSAHPLLPAIRASLHPTSYQTCIESVTWGEEQSPYLDDGIVQPEIAIL